MRVRSFLLFILLVAPATAGCLDGITRGLDKAVYEPRELAPPEDPNVTHARRLALMSPMLIDDLGKAIVERHHFDLAAADGTILFGDTWVPAFKPNVPNVTLPEKKGIVLVVSPYLAGIRNESDNGTPYKPDPGQPPSFYRQMFDLFIPRGYAFALFDVRGTGLSKGCLDLGGPKEQADMKAIIDHLGEQPWSNGKVGMVGVSYDGWTQQQAAAQKPEHLAAIIPIAPVADWYHVVGKGGAKYQSWTPFSPYGYNFQIGDAVAKFTGGDTTQICAFENQAWSDDLSGDYNEWMHARDLRPKAAGAEAPMFYAHGFVDVNARPDHIDPWFTDYGGTKRGFLWQMSHAMPTEANTGLPQGHFNREIVRWFDYHLLGWDNLVNETFGTVQVQDSLGEWRREAAWPPADVQDRVFYLSSSGLTDTPPSAGTGPWVDNPNENGFDFGWTSGQVGVPGTEFRRVFASDNLSEPIHYAGRPVVDAFVATDRPNSFVVVRLYDVLPDGSWLFINRGVQSLRHAGGIDAPNLVVPGLPVHVRAAMQPNDYVFQAGHKIGLAITSSDSAYILPSGTTARNTLSYGAGQSTLPEFGVR